MADLRQILKINFWATIFDFFLSLFLWTLFMVASFVHVEMWKIILNREQIGHLFDLTLLDLSDAIGEAISEAFQRYTWRTYAQSHYIYISIVVSCLYWYNQKYSYLGFKKLEINQTKIYLKHNFCLFYQPKLNSSKSSCNKYLQEIHEF